MDWQCKCGKLAMEVAPDVGARVICYCKHCRAFARHLDDLETLDEGGGSDLLQMSPEHARITQGIEHLAVLRLTPKGPFRWYASCCNSRVANTGSARALPLISLMVPRLAQPDAAGEIVARVYTESAIGPVSGPKGSTLKFGMGFAARALVSLATGRFRQHPFFDAEGKPRATPVRPDATARARAYDEGAGQSAPSA